MSDTPAVELAIDIPALQSEAHIDPYRGRLPNLTKRERGYSADCPWHVDKGRALTIDLAGKGDDCFWGWRCDACGIGGDVIEFVQKMDGLSTYQDAVRKLIDESDWRNSFKSFEQMDSKPKRILIEGILAEGTTMIGGLSGAGKSWFALSMCKALVTGKDFLGSFSVASPTNCIYMSPETTEASFRERLVKLGLSGPQRACLLVRTMKDGPMDLDSEDLLSAVEVLKPVVFLDTLVRFSKAGSENAANDNNTHLSQALFRLLETGAQAIVAIHHAPKSSKTVAPTLENTLRGSGEFGAAADNVYAIQQVDSARVKLKVTNVKGRDSSLVPPFFIQGRPCIDSTGDFGLVREGAEEGVDRLVAEIKKNPAIKVRDLEALTGTPRSSVSRTLNKAGWVKNDNLWVLKSFVPLGQ
jgi:hypothetical protein